MLGLQVAEYQAQQKNCAHCGNRSRKKGGMRSYSGTLFGKFTLPSLRLYRCDCKQAAEKTFSPLADPAANTCREIFCRSYCDSFQPLIIENGTMLCGHCHSVLARRNTQGLMYCEDCREYRDVFEESLHAPVPADERSRGYVFADVVCKHCCSILATVRESKQRLAPNLSVRNAN